MSSLKKNKRIRGNLAQRLAMILSLVAFIFVGGGLLLNHGFGEDPVTASGIVSPKNGQKIWIKDLEPINFEWNGQLTDSYVLEVSRDRNFNDLVLQEVGPKSPLGRELPGEGEYFYRFTYKFGGKERVLFDPVSFTVVNQSPPVLIYPFNPITTVEGKPLRFYWQPKKGVDHYRFQIGFDKSFSSLFSDLLLDETQTTPLSLPIGDFFWRVRGEDTATTTSSWSETRTLKVERSEHGLAKKKEPEFVPPPQPQVAAQKPPTPTPMPSLTPTPAPHPPVAAFMESKGFLAPKLADGNQRIVLKYGSGKNPRGPASLRGALNPPVLRWKKVAGAGTYEVQVSKQSHFADVEWSKTLAGVQTKWDAAKPGKYFWRVRAVEGSVTKGPFSVAKSLDLALPAPSLKKQYSHKFTVKNSAELSAVTPIKLTWSDVPAADAYQVLLSDNQSFKTVKSELKVDRNVASLPIADSGRYYVKVAALSNGERVSEFSSLSVIDVDKKLNVVVPKVAATPKAETAVKPVAAPVLPPAPKNTLPSPTLQLPPDGTSIVSLDGAQNPIFFRWQYSGDVDVYRLEISMDQGFKQLVHSTASGEKQAIINKAMPKGRLYWRVRAERGDQKSNWSAPYSFESSK